MKRKLIWAIPVWFLYLVVTSIPYILGWILVPIAALAGAYVKSEGRDGAGNPRDVYHFTWRFMWLWDNWEDGIANATYKNYESMFMKIVYWSCKRNPINNMRLVPILSLKIEPELVRWIGEPFKNALAYDTKPTKVEWFFSWHGWYSCYWNQFMWRGHLWRFWIGWKIFPADTLIGACGYRQPGAGFTIQLKRLDD